MPLPPPLTFHLPNRTFLLSDMNPLRLLWSSIIGWTLLAVSQVFNLRTIKMQSHHKNLPMF
jgi:hypothetical protein